MSNKPHDYDGTGVCKHCGSDSFSGGSGNMCPKAPPVLTPSEVALAKILAAWEAWPGRGDRADPEVLAMVAVHEALWQNKFISPGEITLTGRALLDRARKAGVL